MGYHEEAGGQEGEGGGLSILVRLRIVALVIYFLFSARSLSRRANNLKSSDRTIINAASSALWDSQSHQQEAIASPDLQAFGQAISCPFPYSSSCREGRSLRLLLLIASAILPQSLHRAFACTFFLLPKRYVIME
jgi:hypothetical protein